MGFSAFEIEEWGPPKLREIHKLIAKEITERSPIKGLGIDISQDPTGRVISTAPKTTVTEGDNSGGGGGGSTADLAGALNGAPAIFHLRQSSAPTALPVPP